MPRQSINPHCPRCGVRHSGPTHKREEPSAEDREATREFWEGDAAIPSAGEALRALHGSRLDQRDNPERAALAEGSDT